MTSLLNNRHLRNIYESPAGSIPGGVVSEVELNTNKVHMLVCTCALFRKKKECQHVQNVIHERLDTVDYDLIPTKLMVPLFYEPDALSIVAQLVWAPYQPPQQGNEGGDGPDDPFWLEINLPLVFSNFRGNNTNSKVVPVGYVTPSDGIRDVRVVILEWMYALWHAEHKKWKCRAPQHTTCVSDTYKTATILWVSDGIPHKKLLRDFWNIYTLETCSNCLEDSGIPEP